ncbi:hypothetical protein D3C76_1140190 [compost metagenome]
MPLDGIEIGGIPEAAGLVEVPGIAPQVGIIGQPLPVGPECGEIRRVESGQGRIEPHIGIGDGIPEQITAPCQPLLQPVQPGKQGIEGLLIGLLGTGEARLVHAVVHLVENHLVQRVNFTAKMLRVQIRRSRSVKGGPCRFQMVGQPEVVVLHHLAGRDIHQRRDRRSAPVIRIGSPVGVTYIPDAQHRIDLPFIQGKRPVRMGQRGTDRIHRTQADGLLQAQQAANNNGPVGPGASRAP